MLTLMQIDWAQWTSPEVIGHLLRLAILVLVGLPLLRLASGFVVKVFKHRLTPQSAMLVRKAIFYTGTVLIILMVLHELNFNLTALLGAAGIVGVAVGFASQTSLSNLISGLFLISEKPFEVGDLIKAGDTLGTVLSIDLLSVKMRTFDNRFVRVPNETLIKAEVITVTRFPIRRLDINLGVAYKEDIRRVMRILEEVIDRNPFALDEPAPVIAFTGFGESALDLFIGVWFAKEDFLKLRNSILIDIKERFDAEGIEIPFPHRSLYVGSATDPFPVRVVEPAVPADPPPPEPPDPQGGGSHP